jgi:hypothetical protein
MDKHRTIYDYEQSGAETTLVAVINQQIDNTLKAIPPNPLLSTEFEVEKRTMFTQILGKMNVEAGNIRRATEKHVRMIS